MDTDPKIVTTNTQSPYEHPALTPAQQDLLTRFARHLQVANQTVNLTRIQDTQAIYLRHFTDSLQALPLLDAQGSAGHLLDVGSGPGVPGLVLACVRPWWQVTSLEATGKKVRFQESLVEELGLNNVRVVQGRAEEWAHAARYRESYDVVTVRALALMPLLLELCTPFMKTGGKLLAFKGPDVELELNQSKTALTTLNCEVEGISRYNLAALAPASGMDASETTASFALVVVRKHGVTPPGYPRAYGVMRRQAL